MVSDIRFLIGAAVVIYGIYLYIRTLIYVPKVTMDIIKWRYNRADAFKRLFLSVLMLSAVAEAPDALQTVFFRDTMADSWFSFKPLFPYTGAVISVSVLVTLIYAVVVLLKMLYAADMVMTRETKLAVMPLFAIPAGFAIFGFGGWFSMLLVSKINIPVTIINLTPSEIAQAVTQGIILSAVAYFTTRGQKNRIWGKFGGQKNDKK
jgi:hypothetical protein